ncbi:MAG: hypothetical protein GY861_26335 [bacterium]|nr:hypothetical protein [bacterium]
MMDLDHALKAIGKGCFVRYVELCEDLSLTNTEIADIISRDCNYMKNSSRTRVSKIRSILNAGLKSQALEIVLESGISKKLSRQAKALLRDIDKDICNRAESLGKQFKVSSRI